MADEFDLLETSGSQQEQKTNDKVDWGKAIDQMKSKLAQEDSPEVRQKILNATLDNVVDMAEKDRTSLLDAIKDLTDYQDEVGIIFERFSTLNDDEQRVIDNSQQDLEKAKVEYREALEKPDTWWNNLWGRKSKIKSTKAELDQAEKTRKFADSKAKEMFQKRIESSDTETLLKELSFKSQAAVKRLKDREVEIKDVEGKLQVAIVEASKNHTKALQKKKEVEEELETEKSLLSQARQELEEVVDKQSTAYSETLAKITKLEQKVEELEGLRTAYITLAASKDSFVHKHNLTIKVLTSLRSNLQTHRAKLKSDTEERVRYYDGYVVALKARTDQEFAAILEHLGIKTDEKIGETLAAMHTASARARQDMMENIPVHEKVMKGIYGSYAESLQEIREKDVEIRKNFANRYGIDMKELFEEFYKNNENPSAGNDGANDADGAGNGAPTNDGGSDDLLG
jgi:hypothetical protein